MRKLHLVLIFLFLCLSIQGQLTIQSVLEQYNNGSVDYITVEALGQKDNCVVLDTREREEFEVSHLEGAIWVGYDTFELKEVLQLVPNKDTRIVVYCSVGVRSEDIGQKLQDAGYANVQNLYGGIFEWKNQGHPVYNETGLSTEKVHGYSKYWGSLLTNGTKVYSSKTESGVERKQ